MTTYIFGFLLSVTAIFLILLVLVQRGRGGGLTGALGGMGGQSAFGTKAGDLFTRVTIGAATFWILLCVLSVKLIGGGGPTTGDRLDLGGTAEPRGGSILAPFDDLPAGDAGGRAAPPETSGAGAAGGEGAQP